MTVENIVLGFAGVHGGKLLWRYQNISKLEILSLLCGAQIFCVRSFWIDRSFMENLISARHHGAIFYLLFSRHSYYCLIIDEETGLQNLTNLLKVTETNRS